MSLNKNANSRLWDAIITEALIQNCSNELCDFKNNIDEHEYSPEFQKAIRKITHSINSKSYSQVAIKIVKRVIIIVAVFISVVFSGLLTQPTVYAAVENVFRNIFYTHDSYKFSDEITNKIFDKNIQPKYVPCEFELQMAFYAPSNVTLTYVSIDESTINFEYGLSENAQISVDNERHDYLNFTNDGTTYYYYEALENNDWNTIIWYNDGYYFSIDSQLSKGELVKIAESV